MVRIPKPITRKRAMLMGGGAGAGLIAYREGSKLLKPPQMYSDDVYKSAERLAELEKKLSRNQREGLEAAERSGLDLRSFHEAAAKINPGHIVPGADMRTIAQGNMAGHRLTRHRLGRSADLNNLQDTIPHARSSKRAAEQHQRFVERPARERATFAGFARSHMLNDPTPHPEGGTKGENLSLRRTAMKHAAQSNDYMSYYRAGRRGVGGKKPMMTEAEFKRKLAEQAAGRKGPSGHAFRELPSGGGPKGPPRTPPGPPPRTPPRMPKFEMPEFKMPDIEPLRDYGTKRRVGRGKLAALGAGAVGLTALGVNRSLQRRRDQNRNLVKSAVRKDSWADEQRYLADKERADAKRRRGRQMQQRGAQALGLTGLAGFKIGRENGRRVVQLGDMWRDKGTKAHTLLSTKKLHLRATRNPLLWAGGSAALIGAGVQQQSSANRSSRRMERQVTNKLAAQHREAMDKYVARGAMPPKTKREAVSYDQLVAEGIIPPEKQDKKLAAMERSGANPLNIPAAPSHRPMFARKQ